MSVGAGIDRPSPAAHRAFERAQKEGKGRSRFQVAVGDDDGLVCVAGEQLLMPPLDKEKAPLVVMGSNGAPAAIFAAGAWRHAVDVDALDHGEAK